MLGFVPCIVQPRYHTENAKPAPALWVQKLNEAFLKHNPHSRLDGVIGRYAAISSSLRTPVRR